MAYYIKCYKISLVFNDVTYLGRQKIGTVLSTIIDVNIYISVFKHYQFQMFQYWNRRYSFKFCYSINLTGQMRIRYETRVLENWHLLFVPTFFVSQKIYSVYCRCGSWFADCRLRPLLFYWTVRGLAAEYGMRELTFWGIQWRVIDEVNYIVH